MVFLFYIIYFFVVSFEEEDEVTEFVRCKIESLLANVSDAKSSDGKNILCKLVQHCRDGSCVY